MDYQEIALEVFNNKESYTTDDYITILNILMESYNKSKGITYEVNLDLKQIREPTVCEGCGVDMNDMHDDPIDGLCIMCVEDGRCERCDEMGILMYGDSLCAWCSDEIDYSYVDL
jgi:hypothetical protein